MSELGLPRRVAKSPSGKKYEVSASFGYLVTALYTYVVPVVLAHYYIRLNVHMTDRSFMKSMPRLH